MPFGRTAAVVRKSPASSCLCAVAELWTAICWQPVLKSTRHQRHGSSERPAWQCNCHLAGLGPCECRQRWCSLEFSSAQNCCSGCSSHGTRYKSRKVTVSGRAPSYCSSARAEAREEDASLCCCA